MIRVLSGFAKVGHSSMLIISDKLAYLFNTYLGAYKFWFYKNYIVIEVLCVDVITNHKILQLHVTLRSGYSSNIGLYYPGICCSSVSHLSREIILLCILLHPIPYCRNWACILFFYSSSYSILFAAWSHLSSMPLTQSLY